MKPNLFWFAALLTFIFLTMPFLSFADCDMMALISIQNKALGSISTTNGAYNDPGDYFSFLRSRSGPQYAEIPLNNDGYGIVYYKYGSSTLAGDQKFYKTGYNTWYLPLRDEPLNVAETAILTTDNEASIVLGHDRHGTGGTGSHPFVFEWHGKTYTFMHNGTVLSSTKAAFMNYLGADWFIDHPSNWFGLYGSERSFIDSELYFHFIMFNIIQHDGDIVAGITAALNCENVLGVNFKDQVFSAASTLNFVLSDGSSLYVFRNSLYNAELHNLTYNVIDGMFIGIKTQDRLDHVIATNTLNIFDQNGDITINSLETTLPVQLTSFSGTVALDLSVTMNWQTASETGMLGFNIYRGETALFSDALQLNTGLISAMNSANGYSYQFIDSEAIPGRIYQYWLECINTSGTVTHVASISVVIPHYTVPDPPVIIATKMSPNYPNPFFRGSVTNIPVQIKTDDSGSLTIYNVKGQKINDFHITPGIHTLVWDGCNSQGDLCAPGVYMAQLKTKTLVLQRKLLIVR